MTQDSKKPDKSGNQGCLGFSTVIFGLLSIFGFLWMKLTITDLRSIPKVVPMTAPIDSLYYTSGRGGESSKNLVFKYKDEYRHLCLTCNGGNYHMEGVLDSLLIWVDTLGYVNPNDVGISYTLDIWMDTLPNGRVFRRDMDPTKADLRRRFLKEFWFLCVPLTLPFIILLTLYIYKKIKRIYVTSKNQVSQKVCSY